MKRLILFIFFILSIYSMQASVRYNISFPKVHSHYVKVEIQLENPSGSASDFIMPVWTPGSYKVREFSRNVEQCQASGDGNQSLPLKKTNKNTWRVEFKKGTKSLKFSYLVYAFEMGVRTSYVDQFQAFLHGASVFMYAANYEKQPCIVQFEKPTNWNKITVALPETGLQTFTAENYDLLADSPFALGNHEIIEFNAGGIKHRVAMLGEGNYQVEKIKTDFTKIIDKEVSMFNEHPSPEYVIFVQNVESGGGGLEHLNSQTSVITRWAYSNDAKYKSFLGLIAHEYFHLWNVKRIRPIELGPFDYTKENYTNMLWVAEGITSYYDDLFLKRCDIYKEEEYLGIVATAISKIENLPGNKVQTLAQSSFDAWIKLYLPDENSDNSSISYYQKGMLVAFVLDLEIIKRTNGSKKLDDVMRFLYAEYFKSKKRGFTEAEFAAALEKVTGSSFKDLLDLMVYSTKSIEYAKYLSYVGFELINTESAKMPLGITTKSENGKTIVKFVEIDRAASKAGISVNDEIIAINGFRVNNDLEDFTGRFKMNQPVEVILSRSGKLFTVSVNPEKDPSVNYKITKSATLSEEQKRLCDIWLK